MRINGNYIKGLIILIIGILLYVKQHFVIGGFFIGVGFIMILKSYE